MTSTRIALPQTRLTTAEEPLNRRTGVNRDAIACKSRPVSLTTRQQRLASFRSKFVVEVIGKGVVKERAGRVVTILPGANIDPVIDATMARDVIGADVREYVDCTRVDKVERHIHDAQPGRDGSVLNFKGIVIEDPGQNIFHNGVNLGTSKTPVRSSVIIAGANLASRYDKVISFGRGAARDKDSARRRARRILDRNDRVEYLQVPAGGTDVDPVIAFTSVDNERAVNNLASAACVNHNAGVVFEAELVSLMWEKVSSE